MIINVLKLETVLCETWLKTTSLTSSAPCECSMNHKWISVGRMGDYMAWGGRYLWLDGVSFVTLNRNITMNLDRCGLYH